jgi:hypothetical protein
MCAVVTVIFGVCKSVRMLQLLVVTIRKLSIIPISNPKPRRESLIQVTMHAHRESRLATE